MAFECSGRARAAERALAQLDHAGTLVFVGTGAEPIRVNHNRMIVLELEAIGTFNYSADGFQPALDLLDSGEMPLELLIEPDDVPLGGVMDAMDRPVPRRDRGQSAREPGGVMTTRPAVRPVINHIAISVDAAVLDEAGRAALARLYR